MSNPANDRNLLFGILALQLDFIGRDELVEAMHAWVLDKARSLAGILEEKGHLVADRRHLLEALVDEHVKRHGGDPQQSLAALPPLGSAQPDIANIADEDVQQSLAVVSRDRIQREPGPTEDASPDAGVLRAAAHTTPPTAPAARVAPDPDATETCVCATVAAPGLRFRVLRPHAEGGLGTVSVALDEELHREVAFKELKPHHADNPGSRSRFVLEAEVTGCLEHPGIVPVYGFGRYADGRPFYAMRFVRGDNLKSVITRFHQAESMARNPGQRSLELRKLLGHFVDVCQAVHYAHCRGVLHRDLKPGNIMLGKHGETLVVDWGLAKAAGRRSIADTDESVLIPSSGSSSQPTRLGVPFGTPAFMSREQAEGRWDELGPASDVYSLGATLYQLLVGRPAFDGGTTQEVLKKVREGDFPLPRKINRRVPKALEAVCLKAMSLAWQDRYASAAGLAEDIEHWLADEPVSAHVDSFLDRAVRWIRHHRSWAFAGATTLLIVTLISVAAALLVNQARQRAEQARQEAVARLEQARGAVDAWLTGPAPILQYFPGMQHFRTRLLEQAAQEYEEFAKRYSDDIEIGLERGRSYMRLGDVHRLLGAATAAENAYRRAIQVLTEVTARRVNFVEGQLERANSLTRLGLIQLEVGEHLPAKRSLDSACADLALLAQAHPNDPRIHTAQDITLMNRAVVCIETGANDEAEVALRQVIEQAEGFVPDGAGASQHAEAAATARYVLSRLLADDGRLVEAATHAEQSLHAFDRLLDEEPANAQYRLERAAAQVYRARVLRLLGDWSRESLAYRDAIADLDKLTSAMPNVPEFELELALARGNLGQLLVERGDMTEAEEHVSSALKTLERLIAETPSKPVYREAQAFGQDMLARMLADRGQNDQARKLFESAAETYRLLASQQLDVPQFRERLAVTQSQLAQVLHKQGDHGAARDAFDSALSTLNGLIQEAPGNSAFRNEIGFVYARLGEVLHEIGQTAAAAEAFASASNAWEELLAQDESPEYLRNLAWFLSTSSDRGSREPQQVVALAERAVKLSPDNPDYRLTLGAACCRAEHWETAAENLREAIRLRGDGNASDWFYLSIALWHAGEAAEAESSFAKGQLWMNQRRPDNPELKRIRQEIAELLKSRAATTPPSR